MSTHNDNDKQTTQKKEYPPFKLPEDGSEYILKVVPSDSIRHVYGKNKHKLEKFTLQSHCDIELIRDRNFQKDLRQQPYRMEMNTKNMGIFIVTPREATNPDGNEADLDLACKMIQGEVDRSTGRNKPRTTPQTNES